MLFNLLVDSSDDSGASSSSATGIYIPLIIIGAIFILLVMILIIGKKKGFGPAPNCLTLQMPKTTKLVSLVFIIAFVAGAIVCWFVLPQDMEYRLLTQILLTVVAVGMAAFLPLTARVRLVEQGNELAYRPMIGKERIYAYKDLAIVVIRASGFDGNTYKYYDKNGKKLFSFSSAVPYVDIFFEKVKAMNKRLIINDKRVVGPTERK